MGKDLARSSRALGRDMNFFGSKEKDLILQTKGRVKINFGDKFIELFNGSKFTTNDKVIRDGVPDNNSSNGFYFNNGTLYLKWGDQILTILNGAESDDGYISYRSEQDLTSEERIQALKNLGIWFTTSNDAINSGKEGLIWIEGDGAYILKNGELIPLLTSDEETNLENVFEGGITINVDEGGIAIEIPGLKKYIHLGISGNESYIYQGDNGLVINSDKSVTIQVDDNDIITINNDSIDFEQIINAFKGLITDEIYSTNFVQGDPGNGQGKGFGLWIDKATGESYLQVDHIYTKSMNEPYIIRYFQALQMAYDGELIQGKNYIIKDFQNEWEYTNKDEIFGEEWISIDFDPTKDSEDPSQYKEDEIHPKYGIDRNVRPLFVTAKNSNEFEDVASYWYLEDGKDVVDMRYDIRIQNYPEEGFTENYPDCKNKGRIYYMKDIWNNEAPIDFKHYWEKIAGVRKYLFNSPTNTDLSSENTIDDIVCSNNTLYDLGTKISEELHPIMTEGKLINNNEFRGQFNECRIGDPNSELINNTFRGNSTRTDFTGTVINNDFKGDLTDVVFNDKVVGNVFNRNITDTTFEGEVNNNTFNVEINNCVFQEVVSNQIMGVMSDCTFNGNIHDNQFTFSKFTNNVAEGEVFSNVMNVQTVTNCTWHDDFNSNQITAELWDNNEFGGVLTFNMFQANVVRLTSEDYISNCQFLGRIDNVSFTNGNGNTAYGVNNNIIDGYFADSVIRVDFSHNHITGPITGLNVTGNRTSYLEDYAMFNFNIITAESFNNVTINHDFQHNKISTKVFGEVTVDGLFCYNSFEYANMRHGLYNGDIQYCIGKGDEFVGTILASFKNCSFQSLINCIFREAEINNANFRYDFTGQNFNIGTNIRDLERLYNHEHQVDVFNHNNGDIVVACQVCDSCMRGEIKMWYPEAGTIPNGWHICDGTEGTPNLIGRFIKADTECKESTDEDSMDYPFELNSENIPVGAHTHTSQTSGENITSTGTGTAVFRIPGHTHELLFVNTSVAKRVETGDGQGAQSYHFAGVGSIYKDDEQWDATSGSGGIVTSSQFDGNGLVSEAVEQEITADFDVTVEGSTGDQSSESGEPSEGTDKTLQIKWPRYYSLIFIMKL